MRSRVALLTAVAALAASLFVLPGTDAAGPPTIVVDDDGFATPQSCNANVATSHLTIASAVSAASANWVIKVCPGTYAGPGPLPSNKPGLVLQGARPQDARNRRLPDARETLITSGQFILLGIGQKVEGFAFQNVNLPIVASNTNAVRIVHNLFVNTTDIAVQLVNLGSGGNLVEKNRFIGRQDGGSGDAIEVFLNGRATISNNTFEKIDNIAVDVIAGSNVTIQTNRAVNVGQFAVANAVPNLRIASNTITQTSDPTTPVLVIGPAIEIENSGVTTISNVSVDRNRMSYTVSDGIAVFGSGGGAYSGLVIGWNVIDFPAGDGIYITPTTPGGVALRSNNIRGALDNGIEVDAVSSGIILDRNRAIGSFGYDCFDGTPVTDNIWTNNAGRTDSPATLCR